MTCLRKATVLWIIFLSFISHRHLFFLLFFFIGNTESGKERQYWCQTGGQSEVRKILKNHHKIIYFCGGYFPPLLLTICVFASSQYPGILLRPDEGKKVGNIQIILWTLVNSCFLYLLWCSLFSPGCSHAGDCCYWPTERHCGRRKGKLMSP